MEARTILDEIEETIARITEAGNNVCSPGPTTFAAR